MPEPLQQESKFKASLLDKTAESPAELINDHASGQPLLPSVLDLAREPLDGQQESAPNAKSDAAKSVPMASPTLSPDQPSLSDRASNYNAIDQGVEPIGSIKALSPFQQTLIPNANQMVNTGANSGLRRHKLVVLACALLSVSILALGAFDLKSVFKVDARIDKSGKIISDSKRPALPPNMTYQDASEQVGADDLVLVWETNKNLAGFVDKNGKVVIPPTYTSAAPFSEGLSQVSVHHGLKIRYGYIDKKNQLVIKPQYTSATEFKNGVAAVKTPAGLFRLIDNTGKTLVELATDAEPRALGSAYAVKLKNGKTGMMNNNGEWLLEPKYDGLVNFADTEETALSMDGEHLLRLGKGKSHFFKVELDGKCGVVTDQGKIIIPPKFDDVIFKNGHALIEVDKKVGFADSTGKIIIKPQYDFATAYGDLIAVKDKRGWHFIDSAGNTVTGVKIDGVVAEVGGTWMSEGRGPVVIGQSVGYVDNKGALAIPAIYKWGVRFHNHYAEVYDGFLWQYIDKSGKPLFPFGLSRISELPDDNRLSPVTLPGPFFAITADSVNSTLNNNLDFYIKSMKRKAPDNDVPDNYAE